MVKRLAALALLLFVSAAVWAEDVKNPVAELAAKVDKHYNSLISMKADFTESYNGMGISRKEAGRLWLKKPGKMRWEYTEPREKLFVSDGKTAWFYVPGEQQARRVPVKKLDDIRSPVRYLLGKTKLLKEFDELGFAPNIKPLTAGNWILRGTPKGMEDRVSLIVLEVTPEGRIDRLMMEEVDGAVTEFRFSNELENALVGESKFRFKPPAGVEVVEATELGN